MKKADQQKKLLEIFSSGTRLDICKMIRKKEKGVLVSEMIAKLGIEPTLLSSHLKILKRERLVTSQKVGRSNIYIKTSKLPESISLV